MQSLQRQFHDYIHSNHLIENGEKVLLAISGGLDSMVMSHLFLAEKINFDIAHCNFGLRESESDRDQAFVMAWARQNRIHCFVKSFELTDKSIQIEARNVRYEWLNTIRAKHHYDKIATAHHLNDSLETILINLARGTGIKGISGIDVMNDWIIRPLLFVEKKELYTYAINQKIEWREDSSNQEIDYARNLVRHKIIPVLEQLNPSLHKTFFLTGERLRHAKDVIKSEVEEIKYKFLRSTNCSWRLSLDWINKSRDVLILSEILSDFGLNYATCKDIFNARGKSGKIFLVNEWLITMDRTTLFIDLNFKKIKHKLKIEQEGVYNLNNITFNIERVTNHEVIYNSSNIAFFDANQLKFPLKIRSWKKADKFQPLGMKGSKKISNMLIDKKVPLIQKNDVLVLESLGEIAWVIGYRISERFKITDDTNHVLKLTMKNNHSHF